MTNRSILNSTSRKKIIQLILVALCIVFQSRVSDARVSLSSLLVSASCTFVHTYLPGSTLLYYSTPTALAFETLKTIALSSQLYLLFREKTIFPEEAQSNVEWADHFLGQFKGRIEDGEEDESSETSSNLSDSLGTHIVLYASVVSNLVLKPYTFTASSLMFLVQEGLKTASFYCTQCIAVFEFDYCNWKYRDALPGLTHINQIRWNRGVAVLREHPLFMH